MMFYKKISVVTVVFNDERNIETTILSVLKQTYPNIEYVVIDGDSTDNTKTIIEKYRDRIAVIISEKDNGIYDAMNKAIDNCSGDWVIFMNSGDSFYEDNVLQDVFKEDTANADVIYGQVNCYDQYKSIIIAPGELGRLSKEMTFCHQSALVKREVLEKFKFDTSYKISADYKLFYSLYTRKFNFFETNICISNYESESGFSSKSAFLRAKETLRVNGSLTDINSLIILYVQGCRFYLISVLKKIIPKSIVRRLNIAKYRGKANFTDTH